jgi:hypothetical protein
MQFYDTGGDEQVRPCAVAPEDLIRVDLATAAADHDRPTAERVGHVLLVEAVAAGGLGEVELIEWWWRSPT